ncbi:hypothetical protein BGZ47_003075, partial [Haplosporangium gracile]
MDMQTHSEVGSTYETPPASAAVQFRLQQIKQRLEELEQERSRLLQEQAQLLQQQSEVTSTHTHHAANNDTDDEEEQMLLNDLKNVQKALHSRVETVQREVSTASERMEAQGFERGDADSSVGKGGGQQHLYQDKLDSIEVEEKSILEELKRIAKDRAEL